jgi:hypothetical protein
LMGCMDACNQIGIQVGGTMIIAGVKIRRSIDQEKNKTEGNCYDGQIKVSHGRSHSI